MDLTDSQRSRLLDLARGTILAELGAAPIHNDSVDLIFDSPAGCFVTLRTLDSSRALRGCIGRLDTKLPLIESIREAARGVLEDPRFIHDPIARDELPNLEIELTIILPLRPAENPLDFDPQTDGIYLSIGHRAGCFLPQVARETGWSREQLLARLCTEKMGLPETAWQGDDARLSKFTTILVGPEPFEKSKVPRPNAAGENHEIAADRG